MAKPTKFTKEAREKFLKLVRAGNFVSVASEAVGVDRSTPYKHAKKNSTFSTALKKAKAERIATLSQKIRQDKSWQSAAWMLERLAPEKYNIRNQLEDRVAKLEKNLNNESK